MDNNKDNDKKKYKVERYVARPMLYAMLFNPDGMPLPRSFHLTKPVIIKFKTTAPPA